jgi:Xaa-Pro aminopeptidase
MRAEGLDAFVLFVFEGLNSEGCRYISGFSGSSAAIIVDDAETLFTDGRYSAQAGAESPFAVRIQSGTYLIKAVAEVFLKSRPGRKTVGFESDRMFHGAFETLKQLAGPGIKWKDASALLPKLRRCKDASEAEAIRRAGAVARSAYEAVLAEVRPGMTEAEFGNRLLFEVRAMGGEKGWPRDDFVVASGLRGVMCHGRATEKAFEPGDVVTVDFGATVGGYVSDVTRNFAVGRADARAIEIDGVLRSAHDLAAAALRPGLSGKDADAIARQAIADAGYGAYFVHGLGHGIGLEVHEAPRLSNLSGDVLAEGDVVTVEPGIYIEGWGGMRLEDDYLITANGAECLTPWERRALEVVR